MSDRCTCSLDPQITCIVHPRQETAMTLYEELVLHHYKIAARTFEEQLERNRKLEAEYND